MTDQTLTTITKRNRVDYDSLSVDGSIKSLSRVFSLNLGDKYVNRILRNLQDSFQGIRKEYSSDTHKIFHASLLAAFVTRDIERRSTEEGIGIPFVKDVYSELYSHILGYYDVPDDMYFPPSPDTVEETCYDEDVDMLWEKAGVRIGQYETGKAETVRKRIDNFLRSCSAKLSKKYNPTIDMFFHSVIRYLAPVIQYKYQTAIDNYNDVCQKNNFGTKIV